MVFRPRIFISAVSKELKSARQLVANTLQFLGYEPVWQNIFGTEEGDLREMLRKQIDECKGVVHLVGWCYGAEPPIPDKEFGRVSYTQYEALYARKRGMKVWYLVLDEGFPTDLYETEPEELARLQSDYRERTLANVHLFHPLSTHESLEAAVLKMRKEFRLAWKNTRRWAATAFVLLLLIAVLVGWLVIKEKERRPPNLNTPERANTAFVSKDYATAYEIYSHLSDTDLANIQYHRRIEECARMGKGRLGSEFLDRYSRLVEQHPENAVLHNYLGNAYLMLDPKDRSGKAQEQYDKAIVLDSRLAMPLANLGIIAYRQGRITEAESFFQRYLELCPQDAPAWVNLGLLYVTKVEKNADDREAGRNASTALEKALTMDPGLASAYKGLGRLFAATGRKEKALNAYQHCLALNYDQPDVRRQVELLAYETGESRLSATMPDDMQTRSWSGTKLILAAMQALDQKRYTDAERLCLELLCRQPENPLAYRLLGKAYEGQGRVEEARKTFEKAPQLSEVEQQ
jgi:tetratricopeptide (TPR) repeat protein